MKRETVKKEAKPPLPIDKPASYANKAKGSTTLGNRKDHAKSKIKSDNESPQKVREKMEMDRSKKEEDPGMTAR